jgi:ABC-type transporter Mla subunit MlaD
LNATLTDKSSEFNSQAEAVSKLQAQVSQLTAQIADKSAQLKEQVQTANEFMSEAQAHKSQVKALADRVDRLDADKRQLEQLLSEANEKIRSQYLTMQQLNEQTKGTQKDIFTSQRQSVKIYLFRNFGAKI